MDASALGVDFPAVHPMVHLPVVTGLHTAEPALDIAAAEIAVEEGNATRGLRREDVAAAPALAGTGADMETGPLHERVVEARRRLARRVDLVRAALIENDAIVVLRKRTDTRE